MSDATNENQQPTTIRIRAGQDLDITENQDGPIRVLVMDNATGACGFRSVPAGSRTCDVIEQSPGQRIRVNSEDADPDRPLEDGDRVSSTPERAEGNC